LVKKAPPPPAKKKKRKRKKEKKTKKQKTGVTDFASEIRRGKLYPDFEKLAHVIQHGLQGFIVKKVEGESTEANGLSHIL